MLDSLAGVGLSVVAALAIAIQSLAVRFSAKSHSVSDIVAVMFLVNLLVLLPLTALVAAPASRVTGRALVAFAIAGLLGSLVARLCYFVGIARLGASRAEPLKALLPLFAVATAVLVLGEHVSAVQLLGVALLVSSGVLVTRETRDSPVTSTGRQLWVDVSFPLVAALLLGIDPVFTKVGLAEGTSALVGVVIRIVAAAAGFGCYLAWRRVRTGQAVSIRASRWLVAASLANTLYLVAYYAALARTSVAVVTPILGTSTLFVVGGAALFLQREERVTWRLGFAAALIVAGVVLVVRG